MHFGIVPARQTENKMSELNNTGFFEHLRKVRKKQEEKKPKTNCRNCGALGRNACQYCGSKIEMKKAMSLED